MFDNLFRALDLAGTLGVVGGSFVAVAGLFAMHAAVVSLARTEPRFLASKRV